MTDFELIQEYSARRSENAFAALAGKYTNLVYSAALRQTRDAHAAEEIAQAVFIILARKASAIRHNTILSGWLLRTTRFVALNARRKEVHRLQTEQEAMDLNLYPTETSAAWDQIAPLLDEALVSLSQKDRDAIALRFFEGRSFVEIGRALGVSEDGAQKRVSRAVEKLRANFANRGMILPAILVTGAISAEAVKAAPGHLTATVTNAALSQATANGVISMMAKGVLSALDAARRRVWFWSGIGGAVALTVLSLALHQLKVSHATPLEASASATAPVPPTAPVQVPKVDSTANLPAVAVAAPTNSGKLRLRVLDSETAAPVADARLSLVWISQWPSRLTNVVSTDARGEAVLDLDVTPVMHWNIRVEVYKDGYVPKYVSWGETQGDKIGDIPAEFTTKLTPGVEIGGVVRGENGEPIPDAQIVYTVNGAAPGASHARERLTMMGHYHTETTDIQGRWHCNHVPAQFRTIYFEVRHADYMPGRFGVASITSTNESMIYLAESDFLNQTAEMVLQQGRVVAGTVLDESGNAVAGAKVTADRDWRNPGANQETGSDGRFRFSNGTARPMILTVQMDGFAPRDMTVQPGVGTADIAFALSKGAPLLVLVTSATGKPIADAGIHFSEDNLNRTRFSWSAKTDGEGKLEWPSAPSGEQSYTVSASGFESQENLNWSPGETEHVVRLHKSESSEARSFQISGSVVDADTRRPIETFTVLTQTTHGSHGAAGQSFSGTEESSTTGNSGKFSFHLDDSVSGSTMEVQADGYMPARLTNALPLTADAHFDVALKRAAGLAGKVQLPDGTPAARATVVLRTDRGGAYMRLPCELVPNNSDSTETDSEGRFAFQPRSGVTEVLVANKAGFAEIPVEQFSSSNVVILLPWGRVEGTLKIGHRSGANESIQLNNLFLRGPVGLGQSPGVIMEAKTDGNGHFVFDGVPPGEREIYHLLSFRAEKPGPSPLSQRMVIAVASGQTTQVTIGGTGRRIVGSVTLNNPNLHIDWRRDVQSLTTRIANAPPEYSPDEDDATTKRRNEFWRSPAGIEAQRSKHNYVPVFETNGVFAIDDVLPGDYELNISISDPAESEDSLVEPWNILNRKFIASLRKNITVPAADDSDTPLDLGTLELNLNPR